MAKPSVLAPDFEGIPDELRALQQWVVWKYHFHKQRRVWIKLPICPDTGKAARTTDSTTWRDFDSATVAYDLVGGYDGVGFVFAENDGLVGIDIDNCISKDTVNSLAAELLEKVPGFVEVSPSGTGLHIITRAHIERAYKDDAIGLEIYTKARYFAITGRSLNG